MPAHQTSEQPLFSVKVLRTGPGGRALAAGASSRLAVFSDRLEIDDLAIYYPYLLDLQVNPTLGDYWNVLEVVFATVDGSRVERCFAFRARGGRTLQELWTQITAARERFGRGASAAIGDSPAGEKIQRLALPVPAVRRCSRLPEIGGRPAVAVHSARVAFPPCCPVCGAAAGTVATLRLVTGFWRYLPGGAPIEWLVPACAAHRLLGKAIVVERWEADSSDVHFSFSNSLYAERFFDANGAGGTGGALPRRAGDDSPLAAEIKAGTRFVVYRYAISAVAWITRISDAQPVRPGESARLAGRRYSLLTAVAGWWTLYGIAHSIGALSTNLSGGIDVTELALAVARGEPVPPHRGVGQSYGLSRWTASRSALPSGPPNPTLT